jgi:uncharacterized integral membrane protein
MSTHEPAPASRKGASFRSIVLLVLLILLAVFCILNLNIVIVKPFGAAPLFVVILVSFFLGLVIGWIGRGLRAGRRKSETSETTSV